MINEVKSKLDDRKRYLQIALNSTLDEAYSIINKLPINDRIIIEAGTPFIKRYGVEGIKKIKNYYSYHIAGMQSIPETNSNPVNKPVNLFSLIIKEVIKANKKNNKNIAIKPKFEPYVVADLKMMDRGATEVEIAYEGGASAAVALGASPIESLNAFIEKCGEMELDSMIDMMNVEYPLAVLRQLKKPPRVVILHRGVDEEKFNKEKQLPLHEIRRIKGSYDIMIAIAGGDTVREAQRAIFNDADIVVVWKSFYQSSKETGILAKEFLEQIK